MKTFMPEYMNNFHCKADKCKDTCCAGWEIEIDEESFRRYLEIDDPSLQREVVQHIEKVGDKYQFRMTEDGRCPLLDEQNLCKIIKDLGEDYLCPICDEHPRFYDWHDDRFREAGIGMACEEAAYLILTSEPKYPNPAEFQDEYQLTEGEVQDFELRKEIFRCIMDKDLSFTKMMDGLCSYLWDERLSELCLASEEFFTEEAVISEIEFLLEMDIMHEDWRVLLLTVMKHLDKIMEMKLTYEKTMDMDVYRKILCYFIYRHFVKGREDDSFVQRLYFALQSTQMLEIIGIYYFAVEGKMDLNTIVTFCKRFSQEVEYNEEVGLI